jgi:antagonist of KipI
MEITKAGMLSTIQDGGRQGFQSLGFVAGGAMDLVSLQLANLLVGNKPDEAAIEMTLVGSHFTFHQNILLAFCGADMQATLNNQPVENGQPLYVKKGDTLRFSYAQTGCRTYLAVKGGFQLPYILGSKSTYLKIGINGLQGRKLEKGDILPVQHQRPTNSSYRWKLPPTHAYASNSTLTTVRYIPGKQHDWFTEKSLHQWKSTPYTVEMDANRMGYRLKGVALKQQKKQELLTEGTTFGTIQIPPNGQPIILMADRQPTGGYPKIGNVITADLPKLAQLKPGEQLMFQKTTLCCAKQQLRLQQQTWQLIQAGIRLKQSDLMNRGDEKNVDDRP